MSTSIEDEIRSYFITFKQFKAKFLKDFTTCDQVYDKLFNPPVELIFYWCEEDYQGELFAVYKYTIKDGEENKDKFIYIQGVYGSCDHCDPLPYNEETLAKIYEDVMVCDTLDEIDLAYMKIDVSYLNPRLVREFSAFKHFYKCKNKNE
jgi:hypothetical protein